MKYQQKRLLHHYLGQILHEDLAHVLGNSFFTITDLQWQAHEVSVYISLYHTSRPAETWEVIQEHSTQIRKLLAQRMSLRKVPALRFIQDHTPHKQQRIEELLSNIKEDTCG